MITAPDHPVFKHQKIGLQAASVNDALRNIDFQPIENNIKDVRIMR